MRCAILIATTQLPALIRSFEPDEGRHSSVAIWDQGFKEAGVSGLFASFKERIDTLLRDDFGLLPKPGVMQMKVDHDVTQGDSFQLGAFAAQALAARDRLAFDLESADCVFLVTGRVLTDSRRTGSIGDIPAKLKSAARLKQDCQRLGKRLTFVLPKCDEDKVDAMREAGTLPDGIDIAPIDSLAEFVVMLGLTSSKRKTARPLRAAAAGMAMLLVAATAYAGWEYRVDVTRLVDRIDISSIAQWWKGARDEASVDEGGGTDDVGETDPAVAIVDDGGTDQGAGTDATAGTDEAGQAIDPTPPEALFAFHAWTWDGPVMQCSTVPPGIDPTKAVNGVFAPVPGRITVTRYALSMCGLAWAIVNLGDGPIFVQVEPGLDASSLNLPPGEHRINGSTWLEANYPTPKRVGQDLRFVFRVLASEKPWTGDDWRQMDDGIHRIEDGWVEIRTFEHRLEAG
jgi:hypothetical protein